MPADPPNIPSFRTGRWVVRVNHDRRIRRVNRLGLVFDLPKMLDRPKYRLIQSSCHNFEPFHWLVEDNCHSTDLSATNSLKNKLKNKKSKN
jgi:hypothetical protein